MRETCYCGRTGELEDRKPIIDEDGREALECPKCGHLDHLSWLQDPASVFEEATRRATERRVPAA
jgi:hypothetical protein